MSADQFRMTAFMTAMKQGLDGALAASVALALHPFDDSPIPGREFEKQVRALSQEFAMDVRKLSDKQEPIRALTVQTLESYRTLAIELGEQYYIDRYDPAIDKLSPSSE